MGTTAGVALFLFGLLGIFPDGRTYAFAFGAFFGVMELVPFIGPVLGAIPPIAVALFQNPLTALWVVLLFIGLQQLEGHIVAPQIFGHALRINPLLVIIALLFGDAIYGIIGALDGAAGRGGAARDDPLPAPPRRARAVAHPAAAAAGLMAAATLAGAIAVEALRRARRAARRELRARRPARSSR